MAPFLDTSNSPGYIPHYENPSHHPRKTRSALSYHRSRLRTIRHPHPDRHADLCWWDGRRSRRLWLLLHPQLPEQPGDGDRPLRQTELGFCDLILPLVKCCWLLPGDLFHHIPTLNNTHLQKVLSLLGSGLGVLAGISFVGIAFAPADLVRPAHIQFVMWAFRLFPMAVLFYVPVLFMDKRYPKPYAWVFTVFCLMLIGYYLLMTNGPSFTSPEGLVIQVVGQKVISYASILSIGIQSLGAYRVLGKSG